jgi:hypothetical protein
MSSVVLTWSTGNLRVLGIELACLAQACELGDEVKAWGSSAADQAAAFASAGGTAVRATVVAMICWR